MNKVIILGNGFIAGHLPYEIAKYRFAPNKVNAEYFINQYKPDIIINAAGFCGAPNVDQCEEEKTKTYTANVVVPLILAEECHNRGIRMIHLGSGCINFGQSQSIINHYSSGESTSFMATDLGWKELDFSNPKSYYSKTKYATDLVLGDMPNVCTLRLRMPISHMNHPRNLLNKLLHYTKVLEEPNSVTFLDDLVNAIAWTIENNKSGIYNVVSPRPITHSELLEEYRKYYPDHTYEKITVKDLEGLVKAPRSNCILDISKITTEGFKFVDTDTRVRETIAKFVENLRK